ncbi:MAG: hypothetical protein ACRCZI_06725 [Cetobacterium sp.]
MAFVKKFAKKTEAPKVAASYARKKREEEVEVEEVEVEEAEEVEQEEIADDYDEQEEAPAPDPLRGSLRPPAPYTPAPRQAPARSFGGGQGGEKQALRLTGLFAGKREGCFSGKLRQEDMENLAALIQEAFSTKQQIIFFLWENQHGPRFSLTANVSAPRPTNSFTRGRNGGGLRKRW